MKDPIVYVIIPNKDGIMHLQYSLKSLMETTYPNFQTVIIDDHSTDESAYYVKNNYPNIEVISNVRASGFAGSVNTGIGHALKNNADYVAIFNSDIKVLPAWIDLVLTGFKKEKRIGIVGFTEILKENEERFYMTTVNKHSVLFNEQRGIAGCLYICSAVLFHTIGYYDEGYFMYGEDNDLFSRTLKAGFKILESNVPVWHFGEGSSQQNKLRPTWFAYRNALRFSLKNESPLMVVRMMLSMINQGCNVFLKARLSSPTYKRMRRYNPFINFILIIGSICWNVIHIIPTLKARNSCYSELPSRGDQKF